MSEKHRVGPEVEAHRGFQAPQRVVEVESGILDRRRLQADRRSGPVDFKMGSRGRRADAHPAGRIDVEVGVPTMSEKHRVGPEVEAH